MVDIAKKQEKLQKRYNNFPRSFEEFDKLESIKPRRRYNWDLVEDGTIQTVTAVAELVDCDELTASDWLGKNSEEKKRYFDSKSHRWKNVYKVRKVL